MLNGRNFLKAYKQVGAVFFSGAGNLYLFSTLGLILRFLRGMLIFLVGHLVVFLLL